MIKYDFFIIWINWFKRGEVNDIINKYISFNINKKIILFIYTKNKNNLSLLNSYKDFKKAKKNKNIEKIFLLDDKNDILDSWHVNFIKKYWTKDSYLFLWASDSLISIQKELFKKLWKKFTENIKIFKDKELQRKYIDKVNSKLNCKQFYLWKLPETFEIFIEKVKKHWLKFPIILKPIDWAWSHDVFRIDNNNDKKKYKYILKNSNKETNFLCEEYIDWSMYSIDFFVWEWYFNFSYPIKVDLSNNIWLKDDYENIWKILEYPIKNEEKLNVFLENLKKISKEVWIINQFIHLEFKINSRWEHKIIEINWRPWWYRPFIIDNVYEWSYFNLVNINLIERKPKYYVTGVDWIALENYKKWEWEYNEKLIHQILNLNSVKSHPNAWFTKMNKDWEKDLIYADGAVSGRIFLVYLINTNYEQLKKDYKFVLENYNNFIIQKQTKSLNLKIDSFFYFLKNSLLFFKNTNYK